MAILITRVTIALIAVISSCAALYTSQLENETSDKKSITFTDDKDIDVYLKMFGTDMMLWRCRNAISRSWDKKPIPYIDLYCEILGGVKSIDVFHNWRKLQYKKEYTILAAPHRANGKNFHRWLDYRVRLHNVTRKDRGSYIIRVKSKLGNMEMQLIYVDIARVKNPRRNKTENDTRAKSDRRKRKRRRRRRRKNKKNKANAKSYNETFNRANAVAKNVTLSPQ